MLQVCPNEIRVDICKSRVVSCCVVLRLVDVVAHVVQSSAQVVLRGDWGWFAWGIHVVAVPGNLVQARRLSGKTDLLNIAEWKIRDFKLVLSKAEVAEVPRTLFPRSSLRIRRQPKEEHPVVKRELKREL